MLLILFFCLFLSIPLIEIGLFIQIGSEIGILATLALIITTALIGSLLVRAQGQAALTQARTDLSQGIAPITSVIDGVGLLVAGLMLITPGFFTDMLGFLCLIPQCRRAICHYLFKLFTKRASYRTHHQNRQGEETILEGEFHYTPQKSETISEQDPGKKADK